MTAEHLALASAAVALVSALGSIASAWVSYLNGKRQVEGAQVTAEKQIAAARAAAQLQIESAQGVAQKQVESAQAVARMNLILPMREAWIGQMRERIARLVSICRKAVVSNKLTDSDKDALSVARLEVAMMMDWSEPAHKELDETMGALLILVDEQDNDTRKRVFGDTLRKAIKQATAILREEWRKANGAALSSQPVQGVGRQLPPPSTDEGA